jgi:TonB-linked SusC/RagA family outer membrane protein
MMREKNHSKGIANKLSRILSLSILFLCLGITSGYAVGGVNDNAVAVRGQVTDPTGEPLIGVSVQVKGTSIGTVTDIDGNYTLSVPNSSGVLQFSYIGFTTKEETVGNRRTINLSLQEDVNVLDELVVVGYDTQRRANLTGAVGTVNVAKQLEGRPITDIGRGLQGATPGLTVTTTSGRIGTAPQIRIRGTVGTLLNEASGTSKPLILVDGVEVEDLSMINPDDVADISVLKDAASSSIYGTRAAFGVLLITTKKGKEGSKFTVDYSNNFSWTTPTVLPEAAKSYEGAAMALESRQRRSPGTVLFTNTANMVWNAESIERMKEWDRVYGGMKLSQEMVLGRDFEIIDGTPRFYRTFNAAEEYVDKYNFSQQHNLSVNGSSGKTTYHLGLGYMGQGGVIKVNPDEYDRYSTSFNTNTKVSDWFSVRSNLMFSRTNLETPYIYNSTTYDALYYIYRWPSFYPYGTYQGLPFRSALAETAAANKNTTTDDWMRISLGGTITFTKDLSLDIDYSLNTDNKMMQKRGGSVGGWDFFSGPLNKVNAWTSSTYDRDDEYYYKTNYQTGNAIFRYKKTFATDHKLNVFAGASIEYNEYRSLNGEARGLLDPNKHEPSLTTGDQFVYGEHTSWATEGFFGRVNYAFKDRYLIELNGRYDGSSRFPTDQLWGFFPSMSAGYILSEEEFMKSLNPALSFAKVRFSWGTIGNQNIGSNLFRAILLPVSSSSYDSNWIVSDRNERSYGVARALAHGFTWENIRTTNVGLDLRFLNNDLGATFDVYQRVNDGMVVSGVAVPSTFGATAPYMNVGELTTKGWELGLDYHHTFANKLKLTVAANLSDATIKVSKHPSKSALLDGSTYEGKIYGEIWGFETDRFFTADDFTADATGKLTLKNGIPSQARFENNGWFFYGPGDIKYKDLDGNGVIDRGDNTAQNPGDMKRIGNSTPRYEYNGRIGLEYKGFDLDVFIQGVGSRQVWATGGMIIPGYFTEEGVYYAHQTDYWTPENTNAFYPRLSDMSQPSRYGEGWQNFFPQTKYLLDMSYCRIKNVTVGYTLPRSLLNKIKIDRLRIYGSFENLFEFDHLGNVPLDPETGVSEGDGGNMGFGRVYPYVRTASFGLQLSF